jgi:hypothetical protein
VVLPGRPGGPHRIHQGAGAALMAGRALPGAIGHWPKRARKRLLQSIVAPAQLRYKAPSTRAPDRERPRRMPAPMPPAAPSPALPETARPSRACRCCASSR